MPRSSQGGMSGARLCSTGHPRSLCVQAGISCGLAQGLAETFLSKGTFHFLSEFTPLSKETFPAWADPLPNSTNAQNNIFLRSIPFLLCQTAQVSQSINLFGTFGREYWTTQIMTAWNKTKKLATKYFSFNSLFSHAFTWWIVQLARVT